MRLPIRRTILKVPLSNLLHGGTSGLINGEAEFYVDAVVHPIDKIQLQTLVKVLSNNTLYKCILQYFWKTLKNMSLSIVSLQNTLFTSLSPPVRICERLKRFWWRSRGIKVWYN